MKIKLRKRKLKDGRISLFLEYYKGYTKDENGKIKHDREFENLGLYLAAEVKTAKQKVENKDTILLADKILTQKQADYNAGKFGFGTQSKVNINFVDYFKQLTDDRFNSDGNYSNWLSTYRHLCKHFGEKLNFGDIT